MPKPVKKKLERGVLLGVGGSEDERKAAREKGILRASVAIRALPGDIERINEIVNQSEPAA